MADINMTVISGRLVRNPAIRGNETKVAFFTIAANRRYRDKAEVWQTETAFVECKAFGRWAEAVAEHEKGGMLLVTGRLRTEKWEADGTLRCQLVLLVDSVKFVVAEPRSPGVSFTRNGTAELVTTPADGTTPEDEPPF